jgi:hypothetical protein
VICEIMKDDGTMARLPDLIEFASEHGLKIGTIRDLIEYRAPPKAWSSERRRRRRLVRACSRKGSRLRPVLPSRWSTCCACLLPDDSHSPSIRPQCGLLRANGGCPFVVSSLAGQGVSNHERRLSAYCSMKE